MWRGGESGGNWDEKGKEIKQLKALKKGCRLKKGDF